MRFPLRMLLCASLMPLSDLALCDEKLVPQVTLPLADYQKLKEAEPRPAATVVERLRLAGTFQGQDLMVIFEGRSIGSRPAVTVLQSSDALAPYGCRGEGLLTRSDGGGKSGRSGRPRRGVTESRSSWTRRHSGTSSPSAIRTGRVSPSASRSRTRKCSRFRARPDTR